MVSDLPPDGIGHSMTSLVVTPPSESVYRVGDDVWTVTVLPGGAPGWEQCEAELGDDGTPLPLQHRSVWTEVGSAPERFFVAVRSGAGRLGCGFAVAVHKSRALPGHRLWRVERAGAAQSDGAVHAGLGALANLARRDRSVLRVDLEILSRDDAVRARLANAARRVGFRMRRRCRCYSHTVAIELRAPETEIFGSLHRMARRNVAAIQKLPVAVRVIEDPIYAPRMADLVQESMARTGGRAARTDWLRVVDFSRRHPTVARLVGLFRTDADGPDALLAFRLAYLHGDHAQDAAAASSRGKVLKVPMAYALVWDILRWAKQEGALWFDFGGVTPGTHGDDADPLGGISDFKRYFGGQTVRVGEDWVLEPRPLRAALAGTISAGAAWLSRARASLRTATRTPNAESGDAPLTGASQLAPHP